MKRIILLSVSLILLVISFDSCEPENLSNAESIEGVYNCSEIYTQNDPQKQYDYSYRVQLVVSPNDINEVYIYNFSNLGGDINTSSYATALVDGNRLIISNQTIEGHTINGSGTISSNKNRIDIQYTDDFGTGTAVANATCIRE
ncbi:MAG TPA: hypothetical protein VE912_09665 [Bacteroidales bacterium]|nr:hypothetical protein [Bacteroidales bacterium]